MKKNGKFFRVEPIEGFTRNSIPNEGETIDSDFHLGKILENIKYVKTYFRDKMACPFNRGNWIIEIRAKDRKVTMLKLPPEMSEDAFNAYVKPLKASCFFVIP